MQRLPIVLSLLSIGFLALVTKADEIDERPLKVNTVTAFPILEWPDWLTGAADGIVRQQLPIVVAGAGDESNRVFVATQYGSIHSFDNSPSTTKLTMFLDIRERVSFNPNENEEGFLGLAFHPKFSSNGELFVYYTPKRKDGDPRKSIISRFRLSESDPSVVDPDSEEVILSVTQPYWNHNGGTIEFGPDGYLYIAIGDGGAANDPHMNGQNLQTLLGKILRIDIDRPGKKQAYSIPKDNPFVENPRLARGEIWAYGLRNVWRFSFDRETATCWAGDVGQDKWEEINLISRGGNYGWNHREARHPFGPGGMAPNKDFIEPIWEYGRQLGKSITGGCVYRGSKVPELKGAYLYADYVSGHIWALWYDEDLGRVTANRMIRQSGAPVTSFGEDDQGEVYFTSPHGDIRKFVSPAE